MEDARPVDGYSEVPRLVAAFRAAGIPAEQGTATELRWLEGASGSATWPSMSSIATSASRTSATPAGRALDSFLDRFDAGAILPGVAGEFSQKGLLE